MKLERKYIIEKWTEWNVLLSNAIDNFKLTYSFVPNILEANHHTLSQIDFLTNIVPGVKDKLTRRYEQTNEVYKPGQNEEVKVSAYTNDETSVDFAINESLTDKEFVLIYDSDPDWGDEFIDPIPVEGEKIFVEV